VSELSSDLWHILVAAWTVGAFGVIAAIGIGWWVGYKLGVVTKTVSRHENSE